MAPTEGGRAIWPSGDQEGLFVTMDLKGNGVYRSHRIHTLQLPSGVWVVSIVRLGAVRPDIRPGEGPPVDRIPGDYGSQEEAVSAAKAYIDQAAKGARPAR